MSARLVETLLPVRACAQIARLVCNGWITNECYEEVLSPLDEVFYWVDVVFLALFLVEILAKLYALGTRYLRDPINLFDFVILSLIHI